MSQRIRTLVLVAVLGLFSMGAGCITSSGGKVTGPMGVFRSEDQGDTWKAVDSFPTPQGVKSLSGIKVYRIFPDPSDANALYLATRGQGLYYSYNKGDSWQFVEGLKNRFIYSLAIDPKDHCTIYVTDGVGVYKTNDCSRTWKTVYSEGRSGQRIVSIALDYSDPKLMYIAVSGGDILVSSNGGENWQAIKRFSFRIEYLTVDPLVARRVYVAGREDGLVRSDDGGQTWKDLRQPLEQFNDNTVFYRLVLNPNKKDSLYWVSKYGIVRSDNAGDSWTDLKLITPPGSVSIYAFGVNGKNDDDLFYTGSILDEQNVHVRSTFYRSHDGGKTWVTKRLPTNTIPVSLYTTDNSLFIGFTVID